MVRAWVMTGNSICIVENNGCRTLKHDDSEAIMAHGVGDSMSRARRRKFHLRFSVDDEYDQNFHMDWTGEHNQDF